MASKRRKRKRVGTIEWNLVRLGALLITALQLHLAFQAVPERVRQCAKFGPVFAEGLDVACNNLLTPWPWVLLVASASITCLSLVSRPRRLWAVVGLVSLLVATHEMVGSWPHFSDCWRTSDR